MILSACGSDSGQGNLPNANPVLDTAPISVSEPDWVKAKDLAQSIYNIEVTQNWFSIYKIKVSYYDLDQRGEKPADFSKSVTFFANLFRPGLVSFSVKLKSSDPRFNGSTLDCNANCSQGALNLKYRGLEGSKLNGEASASFIKRNVLATGFSTQSDQSEAGVSVENNIVRSYRKQPTLISGSIFAFQVKDGFVQPYQVELSYSTQGRFPAEEVIVFRGMKLGFSEEVFAYFNDEIQFEDASLGGAKVFIDGRSNFGICFQSTRVLKGFSLSTVSGQSPMNPCL